MTILDYIKIIWWSIGEMPYYIKLAWYIHKRDVDKCLNILWEFKKYNEKTFWGMDS